MARIVVVEDDPDQLEIRATLLENFGHKVIRAATADAALADCDLVIMDLIPGVDELVNGLPESTRLIVLSGRESVSEPIAARASEVLRKPCPTRTLMAAVAKWTSPSK